MRLLWRVCQQRCSTRLPLRRTRDLLCGALRRSSGEGLEILHFALYEVSVRTQVRDV
jgi:hypothetical protein